MNGPLISIRVPATSANLGAGFDSLGMALSLYNVFNVMKLQPCGLFSCDVVGEGFSESELTSARSNMVIRSYIRACEIWNVSPRGFVLECHNVIPLCRGLGSSSTAVVAGVVLANLISGRHAPESELLRVMTVIEGHPDNVVPCYLGGMTVCCWDGMDLRHVKLPPLPEDIHVVAAVPDVQVRTPDARNSLPREVPFGDAVFNLGRAALLSAAWATGQWDLLSWGMEDRLHQPYRSRLFPGGEVIMDRVRSLPGCFGVAISGSGPTIVALVRGAPGSVASTLCRTFSEYGVTSRFFVLQGSAGGCRFTVRRPSSEEESDYLIAM
ncbi:MAG: homoserine kinase [Synergistaceae bacterium]|jgi:homoserine kinase|nr:homoserine kinase [Synergistaceae bacterium]